MFHPHAEAAALCCDDVAAGTGARRGPAARGPAGVLPVRAAGAALGAGGPGRCGGGWGGACSGLRLVRRFGAVPAACRPRRATEAAGRWSKRHATASAAQAPRPHGRPSARWEVSDINN